MKIDQLEAKMMMKETSNQIKEIAKRKKKN